MASLAHYHGPQLVSLVSGFLLEDQLVVGPQEGALPVVWVES